MPRLPPWQKRLPDTKPGPLNGAAMCMRMPQRRARTPPRSVTTDGVRNGLPEPPWATSQEAAERSSRPAAPVRSVATHLIQPCPSAAAWATSRMRLAPTKNQRATAHSSRERTSLPQRVRQQDHPQPRAKDVGDRDAAAQRPPGRKPAAPSAQRADDSTALPQSFWALTTRPSIGSAYTCCFWPEDVWAFASHSPSSYLTS